MLKVQDFSDTQILRKKINFCHFDAPKPAILTIWSTLNFEFLDIFDIFKCEIPNRWKLKAPKIIKMTVFDPEIRQNWFHVKSELQENG